MTEDRQKLVVALGLTLLMVVMLGSQLGGWLQPAEESVSVTSTITNWYGDGTRRQSEPAPVTALTIIDETGKEVARTDVAFQIHAQTATSNKAYAKDVKVSYTLSRAVTATGSEALIHDRQSTHTLSLSYTSPSGLVPVSDSLTSTQLFPPGVAEGASSTVTWQLTAYATFGEGGEKQAEGTAYAKYSWIQGRPQAVQTATLGSDPTPDPIPIPADLAAPTSLSVSVTPSPGVVRYNAPTSLTVMVRDEGVIPAAGAVLTWENYNGYFPAGLAMVTVPSQTGGDGSATAKFIPDVVGFNVIVVQANYQGVGAVGYCVVYCLHEGSWGVESDGGAEITVRVRKGDGSMAGGQSVVIDRLGTPMNLEWRGIIRLPSSGEVRLWVPTGLQCRASASYCSQAPTEAALQRLKYTVPGQLGRYGGSIDQPDLSQTFTPTQGLVVDITRQETSQWVWIYGTSYAGYRYEIIRLVDADGNLGKIVGVVPLDSNAPSYPADNPPSLSIADQIYEELRLFVLKLFEK